MSVQGLAQRIQSSHKNNPVAGSRIHLENHSTRWPIPVGKSIFVPGHTVY